MKIKKLLISGLLVTAVSATTMGQAEGFFSKLFGGNSSGVDFKTMLSHVPADTPYMFTISKPIPSKVMDFHIKRGQEMFSAISKMEKKTTSNKVEEDGSSAFFKAIVSELGEKIENGKFEETGLSLKATSIVYGYKQMPVVRMSIADKDKVMELLKRAEDESGFKMKVDKCGKHECFKSQSKNKGSDFTLILFKNELVASVFSKDNEKDMISHLTGEADPKESYSVDKWNTFLKDNSYTGFGDGFVNLKKLYDDNRADIATGFFSVNKKSKLKISDEQKEACTGVIDDHINNIPEIIFGTKKLEEKNMDYEMVFKTSTGVSDVLQGLANKTNISKRSADPIFDMGFNLDFKKTSAAMTTYSNFLIESAEKNKCEAIKPKDIRKSMGGMMLVMNMGLSQFKSLYLSIDDIKINNKMKPEKIDAMLSIGTDDPAGLIAMASMMVPPLGQLKIPEDGTPVKLPTGVIPSRGMPLPPLSISRSKDSINIMMGNDKPNLVDYKNEVPELMSFAMDGKRYYEVIINVMKSLPVTKGKDETDDVTKMMETMGSMMGKIKQEITADKRGLVVNYHVQY